MTKDEWWALLEANWDDLFRLIHDYHPAEPRALVKHEISAPRAEEARLRLLELMPGLRRQKDPCGVASVAKQRKDRPAMLMLLHDTWIGLPESSSVRALPGFHVLCRLLENNE